MPYNPSLPYPIAFLADNIKSSYTQKKNFYGDSGVTLQVRNECQQCQVAFPSKSRVVNDTKFAVYAESIWTIYVAAIQKVSLV